MILGGYCPGPEEQGGGRSRTSCSYLLCTILLFVAVLLAVTVTGTILLMNHSQAPSGLDGPPLITTNQDEGNALVTVERGDGSRINIFIDPNCPDYNSNFLRLEGLQTSLLHSLSHHDTDLKSVKGQERALLVQLAEEIAKLSAHGSQLKVEYNALKQGQSSISQEISMLQTEQTRLVQASFEMGFEIVALRDLGCYGFEEHPIPW
ncbi:fibrinogen C domain-containing protein 1-like [Tachysurus ichikawai]